MGKRVRDYEFNEQTKTVRFDEDERARLREVMKRVRQRNAFADPSKLIKELMGLTNVIGLTEEERRIIAGGTPSEDLTVFRPELDSHAPLARMVNEVADVRDATPEEEALAHPKKRKGRGKGNR